ncbi:hypothetical protein ROZALSC1DRAFT_21358, partial [Rozella allomycis CSF55]
PLDRVAVKGKTKAVLVYELIDFVDNISSFSVKQLGIYNYGFKLYQDGKYDLAKEAFEKYLKSSIEDTVTKRHIENCQKMTQSMSQPWDRIVVLDTNCKLPSCKQDHGKGLSLSFPLGRLGREKNFFQSHSWLSRNENPFRNSLQNNSFHEKKTSKKFEIETLSNIRIHAYGIEFKELGDYLIERIKNLNPGISVSILMASPSETKEYVMFLKNNELSPRMSKIKSLALANVKENFTVDNLNDLLRLGLEELILLENYSNISTLLNCQEIHRLKSLFADADSVLHLMRRGPTLPANLRRLGIKIDTNDTIGSINNDTIFDFCLFPNLTYLDFFCGHASVLFSAHKFPNLKTLIVHNSIVCKQILQDHYNIECIKLYDVLATFISEFVFPDTLLELSLVDFQCAKPKIFVDAIIKSNIISLTMNNVDEYILNYLSEKIMLKRLSKLRLHLNSEQGSFLVEFILDPIMLENLEELVLDCESINHSDLRILTEKFEGAKKLKCLKLLSIQSGIGRRGVNYWKKWPVILTETTKIVLEVREKETRNLALRVLCPQYQFRRAPGSYIFEYRR